MASMNSNIDVLENSLRRKGSLLDILLLSYPSAKILNLLKKKQTQPLNPKEQGNITRHNIIWATDSYQSRGDVFYATEPIRPELVTDTYGKTIQPRAAKNLAEQKYRTKDKAEVFTPLHIVDKMNKSVETYRPNKNNWQEYIRELRLEITCGEAPFIVSRYNPTAHGKLITLEKRVGFLDRKIRIVSKYCNTKEEWLYWAKEAFKASYGYEWQGDNVLLARENLLYTLIDYYQDKFKTAPSIEIQEEFAYIISWNIFQMDGLRYVIPMSCNHKNIIIPGENNFLDRTPEKVEKYECEGCKYNRPNKHNGKYAKIMDWEKGKVRRFVDLISK